MTKPALQQALDESLSFCSEYRQIIESQDRKLAAKDEEIQHLEAMLLERDQQLQRFSEAYTKLKAGLEFYIPQIEEWKRQKSSGCRGSCGRRCRLVGRGDPAIQ